MKNGTENTYQEALEGKKHRLRILKYWGIRIFEFVGYSIAFAMVVMAFMLFTNTNVMLDAATFGLLFPIYLLITGAVMIMAFGISMFQTYFPILVSLNVSRKRAAGSIILVEGVSTFILILLAAAVWGAAAKKSGEDTMELLTLFSGIFFIIVAVGILFSVVIIRWGKIGVILLIVTFAAAGGVVGAFMAMKGGDVFLHMQRYLIEDVAGKNFLPVLYAGIFSYVAAGALAVFATKKAEIKI